MLLRWTYRVLCAMLFCIVCSCNVHEWPEYKGPIDLRLNFIFHTDLPQYLVIDETLSRSSTSPYDYDVRYIVDVYVLNADGSVKEPPIQRFVFTKDDVDQLNYQTNVVIPAGNYRLIAWADFVDEGTERDKFYGADDLTSVILLGDIHEGNNDFRDAFVGRTDIVIPQQEAEPYTLEATIDMGRPLAKYNFVSTDLEDFLTRVFELRAEKMAAGSTEFTAADLSPSSVDYNDFKIVFTYEDHMPNVFDCVDNKPRNAKSPGVTFESKIKPISASEAELGFDYIFVNGIEAEIKVKVEVYDRDETLLSRTRAIPVPIIRSKLTTIRGNMLTRITSGGVGIKPDFEDEYIYWVD